MKLTKKTLNYMGVKYDSKYESKNPPVPEAVLFYTPNADRYEIGDIVRSQEWEYGKVVGYTGDYDSCWVVWN